MAGKKSHTLKDVEARRHQTPTAEKDNGAAPPPRNVKHVLEAIKKTMKTIADLEDQMAPIKEQISDAKKVFKESTGIPWAHVSAMYRLYLLKDEDGTYVRECLVNMQLCAEALQLIPEGDTSDMFVVAPGADPNPEAKQIPVLAPGSSAKH